ncbi:MAG: threonylcarbamoyl-AMP synthase [Phycisphaeraceae bacterium]|nr:threonylcarbamoyl-AMP synthase [Phycisphaeraceae bacterium]
MARRLEPSPQGIQEAAAQLRAGGVVAFPTETVYGLGACAFDEAAVRRIFELKGRPADNPLIVHVASAREIGQVADALTVAQRAVVERCAARFWPGPLSMVLPRHPALPRVVSAGRDTVAVRSPRHPVARELLRQVGAPLAAPSANRSGGVSPTTAAHVLADFVREPDILVLDGGPCEVGLESTVLDLTSVPPRVLRPGSVTPEMLRDILPDLVDVRIAGQDASPGTALRHYAPATPVRIVPADAVAEVAAEATERCAIVMAGGATVRGLDPRHVIFPMPADAEAYAARLYAVLRAADALDVGCIVVAAPPREGALWQAVHDRLSRAAQMF